MRGMGISGLYAMLAAGLFDPGVHGGPAIRPTGGHRRRGYKRTAADEKRLQAARDRRRKRATLRRVDYVVCVCNNPCLSKEQVQRMVAVEGVPK